MSPRAAVSHLLYLFKEGVEEQDPGVLREAFDPRARVEVDGRPLGMDGLMGELHRAWGDGGPLKLQVDRLSARAVGEGGVRAECECEVGRRGASPSQPLFGSMSIEARREGARWLMTRLDFTSLPARGGGAIPR